MEYDIIIIDSSETAIRNIIKETECESYHRSFDIPELGLRWPCGYEFTSIVERVYEKYKNYNSCNHIVLLVINPKQWLITKLKYGV